MKLADKHVVITGASSGIGAALAREVASRGAHVSLVARNKQALEQVAAEIEAAGGKAWVAQADLSSVAEVEGLARQLLEVRGAPDVLVNNAGAGRWKAIDETAPGEAQQMMAVPYLAAFELTRALLPSMIARGRGRIVCITSLAAYSHIPGANGYAVARWAMRAFANQLRVDLRGTPIGVTLIAPSEVDSPYFDNNPGSRERIPRAVVLLGGAVTPELVAHATANAIEHGRREAIVPRRAALIVRMTPSRALDWLVSRTGWRRAPR